MGRRHSQFKKILIGFDGSTQSEKATEISLSLTQSLDSKMLVFAVARPPEPATMVELSAILDDAREHFEDRFQKIVQRAKEQKRELELLWGIRWNRLLIQPKRIALIRLRLGGAEYRGSKKCSSGHAGKGPSIRSLSGDGCEMTESNTKMLRIMGKPMHHTHQGLARRLSKDSKERSGLHL